MAAEGTPLVTVVDLQKLFPIKKGVIGKAVAYVHAVDGISLSIKRGETLGLVGESGCGKTTLGRAILRLVEPTGGRIVFDGRDITDTSPSELRALRKRLQIAFQDPYSSLDPRMTVEKIVGEGFKIHGPPSDVSRNVKFAEKERIHQLLEQVGLSYDHMSRLPHEFSGGQKQRIALARALALEPDFVVLDEPTSALDVSVQAQALNLLKRLQQKLGLTYLFISHDLSVVAHMSDRIAVMYLGKVIELAPTAEFLSNAQHPYTQALIASIPIPDPKQRKERKGIEGEVPSPIDPPEGCRFRLRCTQAFEMCGWQAEDLAAWLLEEERVFDESHPMHDKMGMPRSDAFALTIPVEDQDVEVVRDWLVTRTNELKTSRAVLKALKSIDTALGDRDILVRCSSVDISGKAVAGELLGLLDEFRELRAKGHPMHGLFLDVAQTESRVVILIRDGGTSTGKTRIDSAVRYLQEFMRHHQRVLGHTELSGVKKIVGDSATGTVTMDCGPAKMSKRRVAWKIAGTIEHDFMKGPESPAREALLSVSARDSTVSVKICGPEKRWQEFVAALKRHFDSTARDLPFAKGVASVSIRKVKGDRNIIVMKLLQMEEPPLVDVGDGHLVACRLRTAVSKA